MSACPKWGAFAGRILPLPVAKLKPAPFFAMFKQVVDAARSTLFLLRDVEQNKDDLAMLTEGLAETNHLARQLALKIQHRQENERQLPLARG
jgi:hypothetical protein